MVNLLLPHDVVEMILERLPVKSLLRFKLVSKTWRSTINSQRFQHQHLTHRKQSRGPDVLLVATTFPNDDSNKDAQTISVGSSIISTLRLPVSCSLVCHGSCDGLLCLYCEKTTNYVVNPATRWHRNFPISNIQQFLLKVEDPADYSIPKLGFGKDNKVTGTYKPVFLYNSSEFGLHNATTCEVFDFNTNAWRYVLPASPYRINDWPSPLYLDGSLHWLTSCVEEPKVLSFDLHTETFQVICKVPFSLGGQHDPFLDILSILENRLCLSEKKGLTQVIWSYNSSGGNNSKKWEKQYSLDLTKPPSEFEEAHFPLVPITIMDKNKIFLQGKNCSGLHLIHDLHANSYDLPLLKDKTRGSAVYYYQSLFSLSNQN